MKTIGIVRIDDETEEIAETLKALNMGRATSLTLACLKDGNKIITKDIEKLTGLRQPEVSIATKELNTLGWITSSARKKDGKGRPEKVFFLNRKFSDIITYLEEQQKQKATETKEKLDRLKRLTLPQKKSK